MSAYDAYPAVLRAINLISQGRSRTDACDASKVSMATFEKHIRENEELQALYVDAERRGYDAMADVLLNINKVQVNGKDNYYGETNPHMAKVISENIKWLLDKRKPKEYGTKVEVKHEITLDRAITEALLQGRQRAATRITEIEGQVLTIAPPEEEESDYIEVIDHENEVEMEILRQIMA